MELLGFSLSEMPPSLGHSLLSLLLHPRLLLSNLLKEEPCPFHLYTSSTHQHSVVPQQAQNEQRQGMNESNLFIVLYFLMSTAAHLWDSNLLFPHCNSHTVFPECCQKAISVDLTYRNDISGVIHLLMSKWLGKGRGDKSHSSCKSFLFLRGWNTSPKSLCELQILWQRSFLQCIQERANIVEIRGITVLQTNPNPVYESPNLAAVELYRDTSRGLLGPTFLQEHLQELQWLTDCRGPGDGH